MDSVIMQSGIYALISKIDSDKLYIGSAINLEQRRKRHFRDLLHDCHPNAIMQNYSNKYGSDCFDFYVIQHVLPSDLIRCEQFHIDVQQPYFNINPTAGSRLGSHHSQQAIAKIKNSCKTRKPLSMLSHLWHRAVKLQL